MSNLEITPDSNLDALCIPLGAAVSAKFRGAFCEAIVNKVDKKIYCRLQLDDKKSIKVKADDIIGVINTNNKVKVQLDDGVASGIILKIIDNSVYHVVFNDDDTGILRRNQLVLKGDRHYKLSECLDRHPLTNPEQFTKAVVNEKRVKDKSDADEEEFDNEEAKSCSQESMTTVSSSKTRSRQQTVASSASVGTGGSSVTVKTMDDVHNPVVKTIKSKRSINIKYSIGSLVIVNRAMAKIGVNGPDKLDKKFGSFIGLIVPSSLSALESLSVKPSQCVVKSFRDNNCYLAYKRDLDVVVKRDTLVNYRDTEISAGTYIEKCLLFFDAKKLPEQWDLGDYEACAGTMTATAAVDDRTADSDRATTKKKTTTKKKVQSSRTSLSSMDSSSSSSDDGDRGHVDRRRRRRRRDNDDHQGDDDDADDDNDDDDDDNDDDDDERGGDDGSEHSNEDDQNAKDEWVARFFGFWEDKGSPINQSLEVVGADVDIYRLYELVKDYGGFQKVTGNVRWPQLYQLMRLPQPTTDNYQKLQMLYKRYIFPYVDMKKKLGTFEQIRNRRSTTDRVASAVKKARPLLTARERRECQSTVKKTETCSVSSQSVGDHKTDKAVASGDDVCPGDGSGAGAAGGRPDSVAGDMCRLSQCSSSSPPPVAPALESAQSLHGPEAAAMTTSGPSMSGVLVPGTLVSVAYGDDKVYRAKIVRQHSHSGAKSPSSYGGGGGGSRQPALMSMDSLSNAGSTNSTGNDGDNGATTALYKVHYIGWNNRHDEIIGSDRIIGVLSDNGHDSGHSVCSSTKDEPQLLPLQDQDHEEEAQVDEDIGCRPVVQSSADLGPSLMMTVTTTTIGTEETTAADSGAGDLLPAISDVSGDMESSTDYSMGPSHSHSHDTGTNIIESVADSRYDDIVPEIVAPQRPVNNGNIVLGRIRSIIERDIVGLKRRRSRSACVVEPAHITIKRLPVVPESRIIASLNLYKTGDKMPKRPIWNQYIHKEEKQNSGCKIESDRIVTQSSSCSKRHSTTTDDSETCSKVPKLEQSTKVDKTYIKFSRQRSPSFSNESISDASTVSFRNADEEHLFFLKVDDRLRKDVEKSVVKIGNKRGRKPLHKHDRPLPVVAAARKIREHKMESVEIESTSSQHSGSGHSKRITRSLKTVSDHNTVDDNSTQLEEDSQTSQDGSGFQSKPSDPRHYSMIPLATGTPTSAHKGRRPKPRRKTRNSQSNSSVECAYQDSIGGDTNNYSFNEHFSQPKLNDNSPVVNVHVRPPGRSFQRLHPSLIPNDLQKLPPEERVKLLESLIRQTHLNFLDTKDKIKYVEKRISEIKTSRANGHSIESDEDKFR